MADSDKRKEILRAAAQCFAQFGFAKTTMDDIGGMVGLNKASLYYYYKNKEAIFCEIIEDEEKSVINSLKEKIKDVPDWGDKIQAYFLERQRYFQEAVNLHNLSGQTARQLKFQPMFKKLAARFAGRETELIKGILDRAAAEGEIGPADTQKTAAIILAVADSFNRERIESRNMNLGMAPGETENLIEDTRFALDLILAGLRQ